MIFIDNKRHFESGDVIIYDNMYSNSTDFMRKVREGHFTINDNMYLVISVDTDAYPDALTVYASQAHRVIVTYDYRQFFTLEDLEL